MLCEGTYVFSAFAKDSQMFRVSFAKEMVCYFCTVLYLKIFYRVTVFNLPGRLTSADAKKTFARNRVPRAGRLARLCAFQALK